MRGGERVLEILCEGFPKAHIYTLLANPSAMSDIIQKHPIETSWMQRIPGIVDHYRSFLPLFPSAIKSLQPSDVDIMVSTSSCVAKSIQTAPTHPTPVLLLHPNALRMDIL